MEFHDPATVEEAVGLLAGDAEARCLAGGATLVAMMNADLMMPSALVSLRRLGGLKGLSRGGDGSVRIGAMTTHHAIAEAGELRGAHALLRQAARAIGHPAIRNMGTIGGAIAHGDPAADYPAALVALEAGIEATGPDGVRRIAAEEFFVDHLEVALAPGEMVTAVALPPPAPGAGAGYEKFARVEGDFATVSVAAVATFEDGACRRVRLAVGSCGPTPVRAAAAEDRLRGTVLDPAAVAEAAALIGEVCDPIEDMRGSAEYRMALIAPLLGRALAGARAEAVR